jgi:POT family proton-dependent oligopeptide transporter
MIHLDAQAIGGYMTYVLVGTAAVYFGYIFIFGELNRDEVKRVAVIMVLFIFAAIFWSAFEQAPTSLNLFAADFTDRNIGGWEMPATWFQAINSFFVIALAPVFAALWVSPWWLVGSYFFQTVGELCLSPVGLSSMTKLSPRKFVGQMMGIWFLASSVGTLIGGLVGGHVDPEKLEQMPRLFTVTTASLFIAAAVLALLSIPIRRMMREEGGAAGAH